MSANPPVQGNLPRPRTSFVGRARELAEARRLLEGTQLLTLTGAGGSGKTRLGVRLATEVAGDHADGVFFVPLAPLRDPDLVLSSIAQSIGLRDAGERPLIERVQRHLSNRRVLIVLDNFEHVAAAAAVVAEILAAAPALRVVATSRAPLHLSGEQELAVPPLSVPDAGAAASLERIAQADAVRLFVDRARAASPGFALDHRNTVAVAEITRRLDGLPLAIELAAARVKLLPPEAMLPRLERSLGLLVGGARDLPHRQQTLRATIGWSDGLLGEGARRLLAVFSVFRGGADLESIEAVCAAGAHVQVLDDLGELVDQSLVRRVEAAGLARFTCLETIREFASERLGGMDERDAVRARHAAAYAALAERAERELSGPHEKEWLDRLETDHDNVRAAIDWYGRADPGAALRTARSVAVFWGMRGHFTEGRERLESLLDAVTEPSAVRVGALNAAGQLAIDQGDHTDAARLLAEGLRLSRRIGDTHGEATALMYLGRRKVASGHAADAREDIDAALALLRGAEDSRVFVFALLYHGLVAYSAEELEAAGERFRACVAMARRLGFRSMEARGLQMHGHVLVQAGDLRGARAALQGALPISVEVGDRWVIPIILSGFAGHAVRTGRPSRAWRLAGAAAACCEEGQFSMPVVVSQRLDEWLAPAKRQLGGAAARAFAEGRAMARDEIVTYALDDGPDEAPHPGRGTALTRRETEIAGLVAHGLTNREVAARLHLSVRTVDAHVDHVLTKLGFTSRTRLASWAHEAGILRTAGGAGILTEPTPGTPGRI